jgi:hypothetical protein
MSKPGFQVAQGYPEAPFRIRDLSITIDAIAKRACEKFLACGSTHGCDRDDWLAAHHELMTEAKEQDRS